ncbi:hypothetical protein HDV05_004339 [Chytridiales sp. JEL 0842]|nr:hypothetical protein HDV05_004339 [Chytridiales sp. JEL 0842]
MSAEASPPSIVLHRFYRARTVKPSAFDEITPTGSVAPNAGGTRTQANASEGRPVIFHTYNEETGIGTAFVGSSLRGEPRHLHRYVALTLDTPILPGQPSQRLTVSPNNFFRSARYLNFAFLVRFRVHRGKRLPTDLSVNLPSPSTFPVSDLTAGATHGHLSDEEWARLLNLHSQFWSGVRYGGGSGGGGGEGGEGGSGSDRGANPEEPSAQSRGLGAEEDFTRHEGGARQGHRLWNRVAERKRRLHERHAAEAEGRDWRKEKEEADGTGLCDISDCEDSDDEDVEVELPLLSEMDPVDIVLLDGWAEDDGGTVDGGNQLWDISLHVRRSSHTMVV